MHLPQALENSHFFQCLLGREHMRASCRTSADLNRPFTLMRFKPRFYNRREPQIYRKGTALTSVTTLTTRDLPRDASVTIESSTNTCAQSDTKSNPSPNPNPNPTIKQHAHSSEHSTKFSQMSYVSR